jgi:hypothetical protein
MNLQARRIPLPPPDSAALQLSAGRTAFAAAILAAPVPFLRLLGADSATARRVSWLTRMMAVRDGALGVGGALAVRRGGSATPWLLGGAVADAVDAAVIAGAVRQGRVKGVLPAAVVPLAALAAAAGAASALRCRRY